LVSNWAMCLRTASCRRCLESLWSREVRIRGCQEEESFSCRVPTIELKNVTLDGIWRAERGGEGTDDELDKLRLSLTEESKDELLKRRYQCRDK
jgi:hypothetical protein